MLTLERAQQLHREALAQRETEQKRQEGRESRQPMDVVGNNPITSYGKGFAEGVKSGVPGMVGGAAQYLGFDWGKSLKDWAEARSTRPDDPGAFYEAGEMTPASSAIPVTMAAAGRALSLIPHPIAKGAGYALQVAPIVITPAVFGLSQAQDTKEAAEARIASDPTLTEEEKERMLQAPWKTGTIEAAGETVGTFALVRLLGPLAPAVKQASAPVKQLLQDTIKQFTKRLTLVTMPTEVGTEIGQAAGQAMVEKSYGVRPDAQPIKEAMKVIAPTAIMVGVTGTAAHTYQRYEAGQILKKLEDPTVDPEERMVAAGKVGGILTIVEPNSNKPLSNLWMHYAKHQIDNKKPIDIDLSAKRAIEKNLSVDTPDSLKVLDEAMPADKRGSTAEELLKGDEAATEFTDEELNETITRQGGQILDEETEAAKKEAAEKEGGAETTRGMTDVSGEEVVTEGTSVGGIQYRSLMVPVKDISLSKDVPQFKEGGDPETGETEPLGGTYDPFNTGPIVVWERNDGRLEVITGRHRLALARRSGIDRIAAHVVREADGFTRNMAMTIDAESNIRDGQGRVSDYATYFRNTDITAEEASSRGLLARDKGRKGFILGRAATPDLYAYYRAGKISENKAVAIADAAPGHPELQAIGMERAKTHSADEISQYLKTMQALAPDASAEQLDLFGRNEAWQIKADKMAKAASAIRRTLEEERRALRAARSLAGKKQGEILKKYGFKPGDVEAVNARIAELDEELFRWDRWHTNPDLTRQVEEKAGYKPKTTESREEKPAEAIPEAETAESAPAAEDVEVSEVNEAEEMIPVDHYVSYLNQGKRERSQLMTKEEAEEAREFLKQQGATDIRIYTTDDAEYRTKQEQAERDALRDELRRKRKEAAEAAAAKTPTKPTFRQFVESKGIKWPLLKGDERYAPLKAEYDKSVQGKAKPETKEKAEPPEKAQSAVRAQASKLQKSPSSYEEFKETYERLFSEMSRYTDDQVGSSHFAEQMAELADNYPEWMARYDEESEQAYIGQGKTGEATGDPLSAYGLTIKKATTKNGNTVWELSGETRTWKDAIKKAGGKWYGPRKVWSFYGEADPTEKIMAQLQDSRRTTETPEAFETLAEWVAQRLARRTAISWQELYKEADKAFGGTQAQGTYTPKDAYDAMEAGVNKAIANRVSGIGTLQVHFTDDIQVAARSIQSLNDLISLLPTQTRRTDEADSFQQFSTPPPLAYVVNWVAKIAPGDVVLEPSAGTGNIAILASMAGADEVIVNEISDRRLNILRMFEFDRYFQEDAEQINNVLPEDIKPTVVVMNPPFSAAGQRMGRKRDTMIGARHIEQALKRLEPGGRLVAITGQGMADNAPAFRQWWADIKKEYNVRANIPLSGKGYAKYGTTFDNQLIVIDKTGETSDTIITKRIENLADVLPLLAEVRHERPDRGTSKTTEGTQKSEQPPDKSAGERVSKTRRSDARSEHAVHSATGEMGAGHREGISHVQRRLQADTGNVGKDVVSDSPSEGDAVSTSGGDTRGELNRPGSVVLRGIGQPDDGILGGLPEGQNIAIEQREVETGKRPDLSDSIYEEYKPERLSIPGAQPHPGKLVQSAAMSAVSPPAPTYQPSLPQHIIQKGLLSDVQVEAVVYAGQAHQDVLPSGERRGFFIGDGTGVGKGREIAGIILDNWRQGRKRAVWLSDKITLHKDAQRDVAGIGWDPNKVISTKKIKAGDAININEGILFTTYDTLKMGSKKSEEGIHTGQSRIDQIVDWLGTDFDGVIAFDESHNMGNAVEVRGARGTKRPSLKALAGVELQRRLPNARVVYVSATGATEVINLAYASRLGLWGEGTAFADRADFVARIESGGIAAMELVAQNMKQMGVYISRSLSYDGVETNRLEHPLSPAQQDIYNEVARAWQIVLRNIDDALRVTSQEHDGQRRSAVHSQFWNAHQGFFNQIITSMQMPTVIKSIEADLARGEAAVIQLVNTGEAGQERALNKMEPGDEIEDLDLTPREKLMEYIENSFPVHQYEEYIDEDGNTRSRPVRDSAGNPVLNREAVAMRDELLDRLGSIRVPDSPLDMIVNHFGHEAVAEVTGRSRRRIIDSSGKMILEKRSTAKCEKEVSDFNNDKRRILVFSEKGGTGASYHADRTIKNQRRRNHYLVQPGWRAAKALQGLGRTHRSNEASQPVYHLCTTNLKGQMRFVSTIARRLDQLGALTKGQRQTGSGGIFNAKDNLENQYAAQALRQLFEDIYNGAIETISLDEFEQQTGLILTDNEGRLRNELPPVRQFLNRLLSMEIEPQNNLFDLFSVRMDAIINHHAEQGTLDIGLETLRAQKIEKVGEQVVHTDSRTGAETKYVEIDVTNPTKRMTFEESLDHSEGGYFKNIHSGRIWAASQQRTRTTESGAVETYRVLLSPRSHIQRISEGVLNDADKWTKLSRKDAKAQWDEEYKSLPATTTERVHLITGALLPIWDRLTGNTRILRVQTEDGERMLGRLIDPADLQEVLTNLGANASPVNISAADAISRILNDNYTVHLANKWKIKRSKVSGEDRIEIVGPDYAHNSELTSKGVFTERIEWKTRFFIPVGNEAATILDRVIKHRPIASLRPPQAQLGDSDAGTLIYETPTASYGAAKPLDRRTEKRVSSAHETKTVHIPVSDSGGTDVHGTPSAEARVYPRVVSKRGGSYILSRDHITSEADAVIVAQEAIGHYAQEHLLAITTNRTGKILRIHQHSIGGKSHADVEPAMLASHALESKGARHLWLVHNHPSGKASLSPEDVSVRNRIASLLEGSGVETTMIAATPRDYMDKPKGETKRIPFYSKVFETKGAGLPIVMSPDDATRHANEVGLKRGFLLLSNANAVVGYAEVDNFGQLRGQIHNLIRQITETNASAVIAYDAGEVTKAEGDNISRMARAANLSLLDIIERNGTSWNTQGKMPTTSDFAFFSRSAARLSYNNRLSSAAVRDELRKGRLGKAGVKKLESLGKLQIVERVEELPDEVKNNAQFSSAYHGTPHVLATEPGFPHGRFRLDKIGTGEGGQAYGWGIYFAESEGVGRKYREHLSRSRQYNENIWHDFQNKYPETAKAFAEDVANATSTTKVDDFILGIELENFYRSGGEYDRYIAADTKKMLVDAARDGYVLPSPTEGSLYHLDIPDSVMPKLLDLDKPFGEQSEYVKERIAADQQLDNLFSADEGQSDLTAKDFYDKLSEMLGSSKAASEYLASAGIPGAKYLAGQIAGTVSGASNYVIWDQAVLDKIVLLKRNEQRLDAMGTTYTPLYSSFGAIVGVYHKGKIWLIADALKPGEADNVLFHEGGVHMLMAEDEWFKSKRDKILADFVALEDTSEAVRQAYKRVPDNTATRLIDEEALAYFIESNPKHSIVRRIIAAIKTWMMRHGIPIKKLTEADFMALATQGFRAHVRRLDTQQESRVPEKKPLLTSEKAPEKWRDTSKWDIPDFKPKPHKFMGVEETAADSVERQKHEYRRALIDNYEPPAKGKFLVQENIDEISTALLATKEGKITPRDLRKIIYKNLPLPKEEGSGMMGDVYVGTIEDNIGYHMAEYLRGRNIQYYNYRNEPEFNPKTGEPVTMDEGGIPDIGSPYFEAHPELWDEILAGFRDNPTMLLRGVLNDVKERLQEDSASLDIFLKYYGSDGEFNPDAIARRNADEIEKRRKSFHVIKGEGRDEGGGIRYSRRSKEVGKEGSGDVLPDIVRKRMEAARGVPREEYKEKIAEWGKKFKHGFSHFPALETIEDAPLKARLKDILRLHQEIPETAKDIAARKIVDYVGILKNEQDYEDFRITLILADMVRDLDNGVLVPGTGAWKTEGPFGFKTEEEVRNAYDAYLKKADENEALRKALDKRKAFIEKLTSDLIAYKIIKPEAARDAGSYFHHQVLAYWGDMKTTGTSSKDVRRHWRGWMTHRKGSILDYNTEYAEAEFTAVAQQLAQIETAKTLERIDKEANILKSLKRQARLRNLRNYLEIIAKTNPLEDPLKPYKTKIAMAHAQLGKMAADGELEYDSEWSDLIDSLAEAHRRSKMKKSERKELDTIEEEMQINDERWFPFLSYLIDTKKPGANWAATIYKAIHDRNKEIKTKLGDKFLTYRDIIPKGYVEWMPDPKKGWFWANTVADQVIQDVIAGTRSLQDKDVRKVLAKGQNTVWVIPEGLAETLDNFRGERAEATWLGSVAKKAMAFWKQYILINPFSVLKYNINNASGDADICIAYAPEILKKAGKATKDLLEWHRRTMKEGNLRDEMELARKLGVIGSGFSMQEIEDVLKIISMDEFVRNVIAGEKLNVMQRYWKNAQQYTAARENILRLAAFRWFKEQIKEGRAVYGASRDRAEIDAITDLNEKAAKLARELLGDYGAISKHGEYLRTRMIPFYSWLEINAPRYVYMLRNAKHEDGKSNAISGVSLVGAKKTAVFMLKASILFTLVSLYNTLVWGDEEEELGEAGRRQLHLILGRREDGSIMTLRFQGALSDALGWFAAEDLPSDFRDLSEGKATIQEKMLEIPKAIAERLIQGIRPDIKMFGEVLTGESTYPDPFSTRPIRDTYEHVLKTFKLDIPYRYVAGKPKRGGTVAEQLSNDLKRMIIYEADPGEQAYYDTRNLVFKWQEKTGKERSYGKPTKKGNALYYYRQALKYGDLKAAEKYLKKYIELGGTQSGVTRGIKSAHPLAGIAKKDRYAFRQSLSPSEDAIVQRGIEWYRKTYGQEQMIAQ